MSEESSFSNYPSYGEKNSRKSHFVAIFFIIILVVIIILVGLYFLGASKKGSFKPGVVPTPTISQQPPTATPTPLTLDRSKLNIAVLNGSGVAGAAKGISSHLEDLGYTVKKVGNAEKFDYKGVTVLVKKDKSDYIDMLKKDLDGKADSVTVTVDDTISEDADVIVGK